MLKKKKWNEIVKSKKFLNTAIIVGAAAIILIVLSSFIDFSSFKQQKSVDDYSDELKTQLLDIISGIDGVGEARVFLTMDNSGENVYQNNTDKKTKSIEPTVRGVVIVCDGGDDPVVVDRVLGAVTRSLSISSDKVYITKLGGRDAAAVGS